MAISNVSFASVLAMTYAVIVWGGDADIISRDGDGEDSSALHQRVDQLEGLLSVQRDLLRHQAEQLVLQSRQLSHESQQLSQQSQQLSQQSQQLSQQGQQLSLQDSLLRAQDSSIGQLRATVRKQDSSIGQLKARVDRLKKGQRSPLKVKVSDHESPSHGHTKPRDQGDVRPKSIHDITSSSRDLLVQVRSDDTDPLNAVVNQMGQQLTQMGSELAALRVQTTSELQSLRDNLTEWYQESQASTYVHWGSSQCPQSSQLVYTGVVGSSFDKDRGPASNYLCLTMSPVPDTRPLPHSSARLMGAEYETEESHDDQDPVCAVCRSSRSTTVMIPGTNVCTPGWHREYSGYLMAGGSNNIAGYEYICVDSALETRPGSDRDTSSATLYFTVTYCGTLPCGPYISNTIVTCVVCSL